MWPLYYLALFAVLYFFSQISSHAEIKISVLFTLLCVVLQVLDLNQFHRETAQRFRSPTNELPELPAEFAAAVPENALHLYSSDGEAKVVDRLALFASDRGMTFNLSANARGIEPVYGGDMVEMDQLSCERLQPDSVYVFLNEDYPAELENCPAVETETVHGWFIIYPEK